MTTAPYAKGVSKGEITRLILRDAEGTTARALAFNAASKRVQGVMKVNHVREALRCCVSNQADGHRADRAL